MKRNLAILIVLSTTIFFNRGFCSDGNTQNEKPLEISLEQYGRGKLKTIKVIVDKDTLDFLFDTGGGVTVISPGIAAAAGCTPGGRSHGYRMTGEELTSPVCEKVFLNISGYETYVEANVGDIMTLLGPNAPKVHGMISLRAFDEEIISLNLKENKLTVETEESLIKKAKGKTPVDVRLATGLEGGELTAYIKVNSPGGSLWFEWDSGHQGKTFISLHAAKMLQVNDSLKSGEIGLSLGDKIDLYLPFQIRDIIHDGVFNAATVERAEWTLDLKNKKMWVSEFDAILHPGKTTENEITPVRNDPAGWYELISVVNGKREPAILFVEKADKFYEAKLRPVGEEMEIILTDFKVNDEEVKFILPLGKKYPVKINYDGIKGSGTWGNPDGEGGAVELIKKADLN